ncbi:MAG TPA: phosphate ABC transporter ATP-binding protein, partial [Anaerolineae bacterium]|nr:phosphate ABC transporter ATP-binding protein [Anaerolineae bacterium]
MNATNLSVYYRSFRAVANVNLPVYAQSIVSIIGPSGCGKSTLLRTLNRMNDLVIGSRVEGEVTLDGEPLYGPNIDVVDVRRRVGMVFQRPNPFPKSIYDNVAYGPRLYGIHRKADLNNMVEKSLRSAALWDEVKDKLHQSGMALSGGQQQRLCIARALAVEPEVLLMDEPCSALDPVATLKIEELMQQLKVDYTI